MKYALAYIAIGLGLILQVVVRSQDTRYQLRKNTLETLTTWTGVAILWPLVLVGEVREWYRNRKKEA
jgi:hypothetical protein